MMGHLQPLNHQSNRLFLNILRDVRYQDVGNSKSNRTVDDGRRDFLKYCVRECEERQIDAIIFLSREGILYSNTVQL